MLSSTLRFPHQHCWGCSGGISSKRFFLPHKELNIKYITYSEINHVNGVNVGFFTANFSFQVYFLGEKNTSFYTILNFSWEGILAM
jgi:hypothetical protein